MGDMIGVEDEILLILLLLLLYSIKRGLELLLPPLLLVTLLLLIKVFNVFKVNKSDELEEVGVQLFVCSKSDSFIV